MKVIAKCVNCGYKKEVEAGSIGKDEMPVCDKCLSPMIAERVVK